MQIIVFAFMLLCSLQTVAQDTMKGKSDTGIYSGVSSASDRLSKAEEDSIFKEVMKQNSRNLDSFLKYQEKIKSRQKRNALIRIGLGIFFFILLLIGLNRQRKKRQ